MSKAYTTHEGTFAPPSWYSIEAKAEDEAEILIYDQIGGFGGFGISAERFVTELKALKASRINVRLNTPGGNVFDGHAIYNALRSIKAEKIIHIDGLAASIGSVIAMAGDEIHIAKNAFMMIHNPYGVAMGDANVMRKMADTLDKMSGSIAQTYADRSKKSRKWMTEAMDAETWFTAEEAVAAGLADDVVEAEPKAAIAASFDLSVFRNLPDPLKASAKIENPAKGTPPRGGSRQAATITENSMNADLFKKYAAENPEAVEVKALSAQGHKAGIAEAVASERKRLTEIVAVCPGRSDLAIECFGKGMDAEAVKDLAARLDAEADRHKATATAKDQEIAKLRADLDKAKAIGGTQGAIGTAGAPEPKDEKKLGPKPGDPAAVREWAKAKAEEEWEANAGECQKRFRAKAGFIALRIAEETGVQKSFQKQAVA